MTVNRSEALELAPETQETIQVRETNTTDDTIALFFTDNSPAPAVREIRVSPAPVYHTAFMQCRSCCNCDSQCSYFGKGHFDANGKYLGP